MKLFLPILLLLNTLCNGQHGGQFWSDSGSKIIKFRYSDPGFVRITSDSLAIKNVTSIATLRKVNVKDSTWYNGRDVFVPGYYTLNDGGGGTFLWIDTSTKADNGGTVIKPDVSDSTGRFERVFDYEVNVLWFGAKRDGTTDAYPAFKAALTSAKPVQNNTYLASLTGSASVIVPRGAYRIDSTLVVKNAVNIIGEGAGMFPYQEVRLIYPGNTAGIVILANNQNAGARSVIIKNLYLRNFGTATDSTKNGIYTNTRVDVDNVAMDNFGGDGFHIETNDSGNANNSIFRNITGYYNAKNGFFCSGNESNNMGVYSSNFQANGMCGVLDRSFLGNMYYNCHTSSNGLRAATGYNRSWCTYNGKVYQSIFYTNQKGIEPTVTANWKNYWVESPNVFSTLSPAVWNADSTYWITGSYVVAGPAATSSFFGCYSEGGQGANNMNQFSVCWGGDHGAMFKSRDDLYINPSTSRLLFKGGAGLKLYDKDSTKTFVGFDNTFGMLVGSEKAGHQITQWKYFENDRTTKLFTGNSTGNLGLSIINTGYNPAVFGLASLPRTGMALFPYYSGFYMGSVNNGAQARNFLAGTSPPASFAHAAGDWCWYTGTDTTIVGWKCTVSGTPGTWVLIKSAN